MEKDQRQQKTAKPKHAAGGHSRQLKNGISKGITAFFCTKESTNDGKSTALDEQKQFAGASATDEEVVYVQAASIFEGAAQIQAKGKPSYFFLTKDEKKLADAQERENRIRQEMEARKEEARTLAQRLSNSGAPAVATSFFQSVQRKGTTSITAVDISDVCDVSLPHVTYPFARTVGQPKEYNQPRSTVAKMYSDLPRRRNVSNDGDKELSYEVVDLTKVDQDVFTIDRSICEAMADYRLSAYIGLLKIVTKPLPSSRITSGKYLFRNESLNLRSLWTSFILSTAQSHTYQADYSAEDAEKQSIQRHFGNKLDNTLCRLRHWMEVWAGKRRAHQYRKKNEKRKPSSRSSHKSNEDRPIRSCSSGTRVSKRARADEEWQPTDEDSSSSDEGTSNLFVLYGVSGSGKTQLVHQLASEIGYRVIEINSAQVRSAATVKKILTEASLSHGIVLQTPSAPTIDVVDLATSPESKKTNRNKSIQEKSNTSSRHSLEKVDSLDSSAKGRKSDLSRDLNLILVDEVDIYFEEEDMGFHGSILQLARTARCPVVLTAESNPFFFLRWLNNIKPTPKSGFLHASDPSTGFQMFSSDSSKRGSPELCQGLTLFTLSDCDFRATNRTIELIGSGNGLDENFSGSKWSQWLLTKGIDIALFDDFRSILYRCFNKKLQQFPTAIEHKKIFQPNFEDILKFKKCCWHYPVIHEVLPHCTLQTESSLVVIHGRHFLQPTTSLRSESIAHVSVEIGGTGCECVLMSDTEIVVKVAPLCANTLLAGETFIQRVVVVVSPYDGAGPKCPPLRSDYCGDGCGIIRNISKLLKHATEFAVCTRPISQKIKSDVRNSSFKKSKKNSKLFRVNSVDNLSNSGDEVELSINGKSASQLKKRRKLLILDSDEEMVSDTNNIDLISSTDLERDHRYCFEKDSEGVFSSENSMVLDQYKVLAMQRSCESFTTSLRQCMLSSLQVLKRFDALSYLFLDPVDPIAYPDYYEIVKKPIDLHSIEESVNRDLYHRPVSISTHEKTGACNNIIALNLPSITAFLDDVRRIWSNCLLYNCDNGDLIEATVVLSIIFEVYFRDSLAKLAATYQSGIYGNDCTDRNQGILQVVEVLAPKLVEIRLCKVVIDTFPACPTIWEEFQRGSQDWPSFSNFNEWLVFAKKLVTESISKPDLSPKRFLSQFFDVDDGGVKTLKQPIDIDLTLKSNDIDLPASPDLVSLIAEIDRDRAETNLEMVPAGLEYCRSFASSPQWSGPSLEFREQSLMDSFLLHNISIYADALSASETLSAFATELDSFGDQEEELFNDINDKNAFNNNIVRSYSGSEDAFAISSISFYLRQMSQLSLQENICSIDDEKIMTFNTLLNGNSHQNPCTEHDPLHINDIRPIEWSYFSNLRYEFNPSTETTSLATNSTPPKLSDCSESEITTNESKGVTSESKKLICLEDGPSTSDEEAEYYSSDESCDSVLSNDDILDADAKMEMRPNFQQKESPESSIGSFLTQQTKQVAFMRLVNSFKSESVSLLPIRFILSPFNRPAAAICLDYLPAITTMSWIERNRAPQERTDTLEKLFQSSSVFKSVRNSDFYCSSDGARESRRSFRGNKRSGSTFPHLMNHSACTDVNIEALRLIRSSIRIDV